MSRYQYTRIKSFTRLASRIRKDLEMSPIGRPVVGLYARSARKGAK